MIIVRRLRQGGQIGDLRRRQFIHRFVEVVQRRRRDTVGAVAKIDFVEIKLEDAILGQGPFDAEGEYRLLDFPFYRDFVAQQEILRHLLSHGRRPHGPPPLCVFHNIRYYGPGQRNEIDTVMAVEILVFCRDEGLLHAPRHRRDRYEDPSLLGVFGDQPAVAGMQPRHRRRFVVGQLLIVRQVATVVPQSVDPNASRGQGTENAQHEQKQTKAQENPHAVTRHSQNPRWGIQCNR